MRITLAKKILFALLSVFVIVLVVSVSYESYKQKEMVRDLISDQMLDKASNYFDSLNMMMLTGTMSQKEVLRQKVLSHENMENVRVIRGEGITNIFGPGQKNQTAVDDIDKRALKGETIAQIYDANNAKRLVVALPMQASSDYRGTNCLQCHIVDEGTVLGVVRLEYNLAPIFASITKHSLVSAGIMAVIALAGFIFALFFIRRIAISPLKKMSAFMRQTAQDRNLAGRINIKQNDEIGDLANSCNQLLDNFSDSLMKVQRTSETLSAEAAKLIDVAQQTQGLTERQQAETEDMSDSVDRIQHNQHDVASRTTETTALTESSLSSANDGSVMAHQAAGDIKHLVAEIEQVRDQIDLVNNQSEEVNSILDVIRGIAEQTNLLALNAAIEAARAGEQGRGFAVVAGEVRNLASRTHDATGEIQRIIEDLRNGTSTCVSLIDTTCENTNARAETVQALSEALEVIGNQVNEVNMHAVQISTDSVNQTSLTDSLRERISTVTEHANQTAANANGVKQISSKLEHLVVELEGLINQFQFRR
ncbi:methyl-accepting chemotaxis protein [Parasalinivibrio latis]|uniref:methyl-accepting chemotaxis protein n=1 Tax=Parasalinivibrio latis TaxID=2952610 RepID=UPI0030E0FEA7